MKNLDFKASNIRKAEEYSGKDFFSVFAKVSGGRIAINDLAFLYLCGGLSTGDFDEDFDQTKDMRKVTYHIFESLDEAGFLGEKMNLEAMREALGLEKASVKSGEKTKA